MMQVKELNYQGNRLVYRTKGKGPVVMLLHGFGEDGTVWKGQFDLFPNHQLIIPDLPGSGMSEMIEDMSMEGLADAVNVIMAASLPSEAKPPQSPKGEVPIAQGPLNQDASNVSVSLQSEDCELDNPSLGGRGALIGHSMGGYITLAFAEKYPDRLNAFGLFHSTAFADSEEKKRTRKKGIDFIKQHGASAFLKTSIPNLYAPVTKENKPELIEEQLAGVNNFSAEALVSYYEAMMQRPDRADQLQNSKVPVLFVMGKHDAAVPLEDSLKQCHLPKVSYIHILEFSGHMGMIEEETEANNILSNFIATTEMITYT